jgi:glyoxylase-like metal-dependent hydrolase (beta-lactamase superfamily II)
MKIITVSPRGFGANTYIITTDDKTAIVIDPAQPRIEEELLKRGLQATHVLLTHCHFDHVAGVSALQQAGAKVLCSDQEKPLIGTEADVFSLFGAPREPFAYTVDETLRDGEERTLCGIHFKTLVTPGHTAGSSCYLFTDEAGEKCLFTGDTLFANSIGRTDFPTGSIAQMRESLRRLANLEGDMPIYAGHNEPTTLQTEKKTNPFMLDA